MALLGWYFLIGFMAMTGFSVYLQTRQIDAKLKEHLALSFGGMVVLVFWPLVLVTAIISARRKNVPHE